MKLYDSIGPNPHIVRMFMAEKGVVDLNICEHMGNGYRFGEALKFSRNAFP